jgi:hypothetical protein
MRLESRYVSMAIRWDFLEVYRGDGEESMNRYIVVSSPCKRAVVFETMVNRSANKCNEQSSRADL